MSWTEGHPYQFRDEIRSASQIAVIEPFGPDEVNVRARRRHVRIPESAVDELILAGTVDPVVRRHRRGAA
jgi:hypothetical protein